MAEKVTIKELVVELLFEGSESGVTKFNNALEVFKTVARGAEMAIDLLSQAVIGTSLDIAAAGDVVAKHADRVGVAISTYDVLSAGIRFSGGEVGDLDIAIQTLTRNVEAFIRTGKGEGEAAFKALLGPNARQRLRELGDIEAILPEIAQGYTQIQDPLKAHVALQRTLGESGTKLIPMFKGGAEGLALFREEAEKAGVFSEKLARSSELLQDNLLRLELRGRGLKILLGEETVPALVEMTDEAIKVADALREVFDDDLKSAAESLADVFRGIAGALEEMREGSDDMRRTIAELQTAMIFLTILGAAALLTKYQALAAFLPGLIGWLIRTGVVAVATGLRTAAAWALAAAPLAILSAILTAVFLVLEDIFTSGGRGFDMLTKKMRESGGVVADLADMLDYLFAGGLGEDLFDTFERLKNFIDPLVDKIVTIPRELAQGFAAIPNAFVQAGTALASAAGGGTTNVQIGSVNSSVAVNGAGDPRAVGAEVDRRVGGAIGDHATQLARELKPAMAY